MKILIVQIGLYGDMVLTTPMFREIHAKYPDAQINILASKQNHKINEGNPHIHRIWIYEKGLQALPLILELKKEKFDVWLDAKDHPSTESSLLAKISNAGMKIGWNKEGSNIFTRPTNHLSNPRFHRVETNLAALSLLEITPQASLLPELFPSPDAEKFTEQFLKEIGHPVVVNISAGSESRYVTVETWQQVCKAITMPVVLNFVPKDLDIAKRIKGNNTNIHLFPSRSIMDAVSLIKRAQLLISPDTAAIHIASAFNVPTLGLYTSQEWNYSRFRPLSLQSLVIQSKEGEALSTLTPNEILTAFEQFTL